MTSFTALSARTSWHSPPVPSKGLPRYPNYRGTFGTSLAVVTALMASITTAMVVVMAADQTAQSPLGFLSWTPDQVGVVVGSAGTVLFVAASLACVYAQAANPDEVPGEVRERWSAGRVDWDEQVTRWHKSGEASYRWARVFWINGISLFLLTLGTLAYGMVRPELAVAGLAAGLVAMLNIADREFRGVRSVAMSLMITAVSLVIAVAAGQATWA
jgi:hypothetical protein